MADQDENLPGGPGAGGGPRGLEHRILKPGESFGNYRIVRCLCSGLVINYYRAQHVRDLRDVTLGIFHPRTVEDTRFLRRLTDLKQALGGFDHDSVPKILDCAQIERLHCVFMEPVDGTTLSDFFGKRVVHMEKPGGLTEDEVREISANLLGVLGVAHSHGVDHRDLDSNFILLQPDGSLRLLGLGFRAAVGLKIFEAIVSASVSPLASKKAVQHMTSIDVISPEYQMGIAEDHRVDINGVGVLAYWLLTGHKPRRSDYVPPSQIVEGLSPKWDKFVASSIARNLDDRYSSAKIALMGLAETHPRSAVEGGKAVQHQIERIPVPGSIRQRGEQTARIFRLSVIGVIGVLLTGLASYFFVSTFAPSEKPARSVAREVRSPTEADVILEVAPPSAEVKVESTGERFTATDGRLYLQIDSGEHRLIVSAPNHVSVPLVIDRDSGEKLELAAGLEPAWTDFKVRTVPGASITVIDPQGREIALGRADAEGLFFLEKGVFAGVYDIIVEREGYQRGVANARELVFGQENEIVISLVGEPATLLVRSSPEGATVLLNGVIKGRTPLRLEEVETGEKQLVTVELEGFRGKGQSVELNPGEERVLDLGRLVPPTAEIIPQLALPDGGKAGPEVLGQMTLEVDGELFPFDGERVRDVPAGQRTVRFLHPLYRSAPLSLELEDREERTVAAALEYRPAEVRLVIPGGLAAQAMLEGKLIEIQDGRVEVPARTPVELAVQIPDHLIMRRLLELGPNETFVWEVEPVPIPSPEPGDNWMVPYIGVEMVWVPAGTFEMGSSLFEVGRLPDEGPITEVRFTRGFWVGIHEVTQSQYYRVMKENPSIFPGGSRPVENLTWGEARTFCELLTSLERTAGRVPEGYVYRLPVEAEWEYAARAGTETAFYWGPEASSQLGNFQGRYPPEPGRDDETKIEVEHYGTLPVGRFRPNTFGLFDVHGNVRELTFDFYNGRHPGGKTVDPPPRRDGLSIATRGGSWKDRAVHARSAERSGIRANTRSNAVGFRIVLAPGFD